uniref:hypothetical protein n=1 Tax=Flavobacterium sp. TaxID=239 RepID=UPI00404B9F0A
MEQEYKIFEQFKSAAERSETKEFPGMDKVWDRVENKLDHQILTHQNSLWKKFAFGASVLLVVSVCYHFLKEDKKVVIPNEEIVTDEAKETIADTVLRQEIVENETLYLPIIHANAETILETQIQKNRELVATDSMIVLEPKLEIPINNNTIEFDTIQIKKTAAAASMVAAEQANPNEKVTRKDGNNGYFNDGSGERVKQQSGEKEKPLLVVDNQVENLKKLNNLNPNDVEEIMVLTEPLYIINGVEYTEKELFGPEPTSPYAPLDKQKIETISILQDEEAVSTYGEKGKKGVVIITTKGGKPLKKKK